MNRMRPQLEQQPGGELPLQSRQRHTPPVAAHPLAVLRRRPAAALLGISVATLDRLRSDANNGFPAPIRLSEQAIGWLTGDIEDWIASRPRVSSY